MTRTYTLDEPRPAWQEFVEEAVFRLRISTWQRDAALQLIRGLEIDDLAIPFMDLGSLRDRGVASFRWISSERSVVALPVQIGGRMYAELALWDRGELLCTGMRHAPVPMLRGVLRWVYQGE